MTDNLQYEFDFNVLLPIKCKQSFDTTIKIIEDNLSKNLTIILSDYNSQQH